MGTKRVRVRNQNGMSLVELLAALVLVGLVVVLINTVFLFTERNADSLSAETDVQKNLMLAMKVVTKDIRSADSVEPNSEGLLLNGKDRYTLENRTLLKNGDQIATDIASFTTCHPPIGRVYTEEEPECIPIQQEQANDRRVIVILEGLPNRSGEKRSLATEINLER